MKTKNLEPNSDFSKTCGKIVYVQTLPGESKENLILRKLHCGSVADAINRFKLQNYDGDIWQKLESLCANEVTIQRNLNRISRIFGKLRRVVS